ncbi:MAG: hypothetical protein ABJD07_09660 [Gemmatimonadaceae bacterium]
MSARARHARAETAAVAHAAPELRIRIKKNPDGSAALTCVRRDGSSTWQRQLGKVGLVFPPHDLTHYAVETTLGYRRGFYGLVADGWQLDDFRAPWPRGALPAEAVEVEMIVGFFDMERLMGARLSVEEFNGHAVKFVEGRRSGAVAPLRPLTADELARVRALRADVLGRWGAVADGATLELAFDRAQAPIESR